MCTIEKKNVTSVAQTRKHTEMVVLMTIQTIPKHLPWRVSSVRDKHHEPLAKMGYCPKLPQGLLLNSVLFYPWANTLLLNIIRLIEEALSLCC